ncbi:MAG: hypothetical protein K1X28_02960 [Parachlamydiales bacterium]|nr:hypothetical protein [Parachlamydiales bacterium]
MTLEEKIGQLFVMPVCPRREDDHFEDLLKIMREYHIGNVIVKQSDPATQIQFLKRLQEASILPLLVTADAEWGLAMRMADTIAFPRNMTLGAIQDLSLLKEFGAEIGRQARLVGIHMNLAPVADVNNNPLNPVIHMRSFGEDPNHVADCVAAVSKGMQESGCFTCAKHFPGHGDTHVDSHRDLPVIEHSRERLETVELVPFQRAVDEGVDALMTAHLYVPAIDHEWPTSLSGNSLRIAREILGFKGLIISDALNMRAVSERYSPERVAYMARAAGCDLLLYGDHIDPNVNQIIRDTIPRAVSALKKAYRAGDLRVEDLDRTVLMILEKKEKIGGFSEGVLNTKEAMELKQKLFQEAVTLIGEKPKVRDAAYISFGTGDVLGKEFETLSPEEASTVVIAIHQKEALTPEVLETIIRYSDKAIVCHFATPYALKGMKAKTILIGYENDPIAQKAVLNVLLGLNEPNGKLPVSLQ